MGLSQVRFVAFVVAWTGMSVVSGDNWLLSIFSITDPALHYIVIYPLEYYCTLESIRAFSWLLLFFSLSRSSLHI